MHLLVSPAAAVGSAPAPAAGYAPAAMRRLRSSRSEARIAVVALLPSLAAPLNPAERTMVRAGIPPIETRTAKPLALRRAPVSGVAASRTSERLLAWRSISLPGGSFSRGAPVTVRQCTVGIRNS
jgi:hypothetical protein